MLLSSTASLRGTSSRVCQSAATPRLVRLTAAPHHPLSSGALRAPTQHIPGRSLDSQRVGAGAAKPSAAKGEGDGEGEEQEVRRNKPFSQAEKDRIRQAMQEVKEDCAAQGVDYTYKAVFHKFVELSGNTTTRQYAGIKGQVKIMEREDAQSAQGGTGGAPSKPGKQAASFGPKQGPAVTAAQMLGEIMSTKEGMEATRDEVLQELAIHPIYCHLLTWSPLKNIKTPKIMYSWQYTCEKALVSKKYFKKSRMLSANNRRVYIFDPTTPDSFDNLWRGMPWVLASLLTTYLAKPGAGNKVKPASCTAAELTKALLEHPMYGAVLVQQDGGRAERLTVERFVSRVEAELEKHVGDLFEKKGGHYTAIIRPLVLEEAEE